ncbi:vanadium-dependent haloperoxidase [Streptomyces phaeochromogenes]|uniref:vanadium-dependent haloperoxidase n=1 Tax=Streptomyces phaeochromogenes TaxID=1923 RepID=UPI0036AB3034
MTAFFRRSRARTATSLAAVVALSLTMGAAETTFGSSTQQKAATSFDLDNGNVFFEVLYPEINPAVRKYVSQTGVDAPLVLRVTTLVTNGWFDAIAPYHSTAVGVYSDLGRRPADEAKNRNKNIAIMYASYRVLNSVLPQNRVGWRDMMKKVGLDPDDTSEDRTTPVGLGNLAGNAVVSARAHDGLNQLGDTDRTYNRQPYQDYTGYKPVNTPYELRDPSRWQPAVLTKGNGIFTVQQFVTPQWRFTKPYSYKDPKQFTVPAPRNSDHHNRAAYRKQVDEVLAASAALNDERKMKSQFFNDKFLGVGYPTIAEAVNHGLRLDEYVHASFAGDVAAYDGGIAAWHNKARYDAVRPPTAVRHVYGKKHVTAWGGPGKGTVDDIPAVEWQPFMELPDHPEYPSGSTALCAAVAQVGRLTHGTEKVDISYRFERGSSFIEPGITPAKTLELNWKTWSDYVRDCGLSRLWGGVHFKSAIEASWKMGKPIGEHAYAFVQSHVKGERPGTGR